MADAQVLAKIPQVYFDAWNGRDNHALDGFYADRFTWTDPLLPGPLDSLEGAQGFLSGGWAGFSDLRFELIGGPLVDEANGRVAQTWRMLGTHDGEFPPGAPPTGKPVDIIGTDVWTVNDAGQVTELRACYDALTVMRQLGLA
ncbi:MAG: ester cyclase [Acidimicrobiia bacterium]